MASGKDKLDTAATRMKTRGFGGYLVDRALNRADFEDAPAAVGAKANMRKGIGGANSANDAAREAAGMKKGGAVRGWGGARGARKAKYR